MKNEEVESYPITWVIGQNVFLITYFAVATFGMYPLQINGVPVFSACYAAFIVTMLCFVLRKHLCTNCYYYGKMCNTGWGKFAVVFRTKGNYEAGGKLAGLTWMLATLVPIIVMGVEAHLNLISIPLLCIFVVMSGINFLIHGKSCERCKMKSVCPARKK